MYQPPQESNSLLDDAAKNPAMTDERRAEQRDSGSWMSYFKSHSAPFSYEYVFEDGRMPFLSEVHPVKRKDLPSMFGMPALPPVSPNEEMRLQKASLKRSDKHAHFGELPPPAIRSHQYESTADKLKRALSLSGIKSSHSRSQSANLPQRAKTEPRRQQSPAVNPPPLIAPRLVLPTPSPSPEPMLPSQPRNSTASSFRSAINSSVPRSSWTWASTTSSLEEEEDRYDLALLQETAMGRLDPSPMPTPTYELRRDKAFALLGITDMPLTPPYTPAVSVAPSLSDYHSRLNSRRTSVDQARHSHYSSHRRESSTSPRYEKALPVPHHTPSPPATPNDDLLKTPRAPNRSSRRPVAISDAPINIPLPPTPVEDVEMTPRQPVRASTFPVAMDISQAPTSPRRTLKRKQSKFIEHLDSSPEIIPVSPRASNRPIMAPIVFDFEPVMSGAIPSPTKKNAPSSQVGKEVQPAFKFTEKTTTMSNPAATITAAEPPLPLTLEIPLDNAFDISFPLTLPTSPAPPPVPPKIPVARAIPLPAPMSAAPVLRVPEHDLDAITPCEVQYPAHLLPRRSMSMRESRTKSWGASSAVVCTAEVRPIVAMGSAKLITS